MSSFADCRRHLSVKLTGDLMGDDTRTKAQLIRQLNSLRKECSRLQSLALEAERSRRTQKIITDLLLISLKKMPLERILESVIDKITSIEWLSFESMGAIFLVNNQTGLLDLAAWRAFPDEAIKACKSIPFGHCLCGRAASSGSVIFADCIDERHDIRYLHIPPHGHYCVPIISSDSSVVGVVTLYVKEGHSRNQLEEHFLETVASSLANIIEFKLIENELNEKQKELEIKNRTIEDANTALKVLLKKRQEDQEEIEKGIAYNIKMLVEPHLERLKSAKLSDQHRAHLELLELNLVEITSPFAHKLANTLKKLTPAELQVASMVKQGKSTKEIAQSLYVSDQTISVHRRNIRKKLQLSKLKANLRTYLLSIAD